VPFVGTPAFAAEGAFNKASASQKLLHLGYPQLPLLSLTIAGNAGAMLSEWAAEEQLDAEGTYVVKPAKSGSSIGVSLAQGLEEAAHIASKLLAGGGHEQVVVQPYLNDALEFSVCVIDTPGGPVALPPTEIELMPHEDDAWEAEELRRRFHQHTGMYSAEELPVDFYLEEATQPAKLPKPPRLFDYRRKYLPSTQVQSHTPARCARETLNAIRFAATKLFLDFGLRDFARIDGWVMPNGSVWAPQRVRPNPADITLNELFTVKGVDNFERIYRPGEEDTEAAAAAQAQALEAVADLDDTDATALCQSKYGTVIFSDINLTSGMEQASFLFQQAASVGINHATLLRHLYNMAASRAGLPELPSPQEMKSVVSSLAADPFERHDLEGAKAADVCDDDGKTYSYSPPTDLGWDAFRTRLEKGTETIGLPLNQFLMDDDPRNTAALGTGAPSFQDFPLSWTIHPKYANPDIKQGRMQLRRYSHEYPEPADKTGFQRVYVLMGGETSERQVSLMSGINVWLTLQGCPDVIAEPFVITPNMGMEDERKRRNAIRERLLYYEQLGLDETELRLPELAAHLDDPAVRGAEAQYLHEMMEEADEDYPEIPVDFVESTREPHTGDMGADLGLDYLNCPRPVQQAMGDRNLWAVPPHLMLRHTVEEIHDACKNANSLATQPDDDKDPVLLAQSMCRAATQREAADAGLTGVASAWNALSPYDDPPGAHLMNMEQFADMARLNNAVVFVATHGGCGENGELQAFLEEHDVLFTGSKNLCSEICIDKVQTAHALMALEPKGISSAPKEIVDLEAMRMDPEEEYTRLLELLPPTQSICIKPVADGCSTGVAKISSADDFVAYADAFLAKEPVLRAGSLSGQSCDIEMPLSGTGQLMVEPFVDTDPITIRKSASGADEVEWAGNSRWVEVTVGIIGEEGAMHALTPSVVVCERGDVLTLEEKFESGVGTNLTPPPASIVTPEALKGARQRCELVADVLGLSGVARIDAFMHVDTGEIVVIEVNTVPAFTPHTVLLHQALQEDPPMYPQDLFRTVVELALLPPVEANLAGMDGRDDTFLEDDTWYDDVYEDDGQVDLGSGGGGSGWGWDESSGDEGQGWSDTPEEAEPASNDGGW